MKRFFSSYLTLFFAGIISIVAINAFHLLNGKQTGEIAANVQGWFYLVVLAFWVRQDSTRRGEGFPADLAMLNGYIPLIYVLHSRGWKGCGILALLFVLFVVALIAMMIYSGV